MKRNLFLIILLSLVAVTVSAKSFTYRYKGIEFKCKTDKKGKTVIFDFDTYASNVVIPAKVRDDRGMEHKVDIVSFFAEAVRYNANVIAIEPGITEIDDYCFYCFPKLTSIMIPGTVEKIGRKAFRSSCVPTVKSTLNINKSDLIAGNVIYTKTLDNVNNAIADVDMSLYGGAKQDVDNSVANAETHQAAGITPGTSDVDYNIPNTGADRPNTFCLIIVNENYRSNDTPNVRFAAQDGETFRNYCLRTLGLPEENIRLATNASYLQMKSLLDWFVKIGGVYGEEAKFIFYYAGHGVPDEGGNCKLIPADVSINDVGNGFSLKELYASLGRMTKSNVLVLIDACFSGNDRGDVAAIDDVHRGIIRKVKQETLSGNIVALTAASGTETALSYDEKAHGLFSYFVMKKLQETKGNVTYGELYEYVKKQVMRRSIVSKSKKQTPSASVSLKMESNWKNIKL